MTPHGPTPQICLLRHGTTRWNREGRYLSRTDLPIDAEGRRELAAAAPAIAAFAPQETVISPTRRARETYKELVRLGAIRSGGVRVDHEAREVDFGRFEGRPRSEIAASSDGEAFHRWFRPECGRPAAPGGESFAAAAGRVERVLARLTPARTLLVSHGYFLKVLLATRVLGTDPDDIRQVHLPNGVPILLARTSAGWVRVDSRPRAAGKLQ